MIRRHSGLVFVEHTLSVPLNHGDPQGPHIEIFAQTLPGVEASNLELFIGIGTVVVVNAVFTLALARREVTLQSTALAFVARTMSNVALVAVASWLLGSGDLEVAPTLFFLTLISLITTLHDRWHPVHGSRVAALATPEVTRLG